MIWMDRPSCRTLEFTIYQVINLTFKENTYLRKRIVGKNQYAQIAYIRNTRQARKLLRRVQRKG